MLSSFYGATTAENARDGSMLALRFFPSLVATAALRASRWPAKMALRLAAAAFLCSAGVAAVPLHRVETEESNYVFDIYGSSDRRPTVRRALSVAQRQSGAVAPTPTPNPHAAHVGFAGG